MNEPTSITPHKTSKEKDRRGHKLSDKDLKTIYSLIVDGKNDSEIERLTGITRGTVSKYRNEKVDGVPSTPMQEKALEVRNWLLQHYNPNIEETLIKSYALLDLYEDKLAEKVMNNDIPPIVTALQLKQIVDGKAALLRLPSDLNKGRKDIYQQIAERDNEITDAEYEELREAGDLG